MQHIDSMTEEKTFSQRKIGANLEALAAIRGKLIIIKVLWRVSQLRICYRNMHLAMVVMVQDYAKLFGRSFSFDSF